MINLFRTKCGSFKWLFHQRVVKNFYSQNVEEEKDYMNKLVNNKKEFDKNNNERNKLLDYKYIKIVNDIKNNDINDEYNLIKNN